MPRRRYARQGDAKLRWAGGRYDPDDFDPKTVKFDNPWKRWKKAFGE